MMSAEKENRRNALVIVKAVKSMADEKLSYLFDGLAANVADALFEEMCGMDKNEVLKLHFNVMCALKVGSRIYRKEFDRLMNEAWRVFLRRHTIPSLEMPTGVAGEQIALCRDKVESYHKMLIQDIQDRLSHLLNSKLDDCPLRPGILYLCFWHSIEKLDLNYDERVLLVPLFHRFVMDRFGLVLGVANKTLTEHAIVMGGKAATPLRQPRLGDRAWAVPPKWPQKGAAQVSADS